MGRLTTHVLDTARGCPASGIKIELRRVDNGQGDLVATAITNADGRTDAPMLASDVFHTGCYELTFFAGDYFDATGLDLPDPKFLDQVVIRFGLSAQETHYHVPLLLSPFGYSTYRGS